MRQRPQDAFLRYGLAVLIVCFLPGVLRCVLANAPASDLGSFPAVVATSLDKTHFDLPKDFGGEVNLVMIFFAREQQQDVDSWLPEARQLESRNAKLRYYELPTTSRENLLYRWWFNSALRSNTTDTALDGRILTLYVSKRKFRRSLEIANEKQIVTVLVDRSGRILWREDGAFSPEKGQSLNSVLAANGR